jgi:hypothetical protein
MIIVISIIIVIIVALAYFRLEYATKQNLKCDLVEADNKCAELTIDRVKLEERVKELEDGIEKNFGVTVRIVKNVIDCNFDENELLYILSGTKDQIKAGYSSIDDIEFLLALHKKTQSIVNKFDTLPRINSRDS